MDQCCVIGLHLLCLVSVVLCHSSWKDDHQDFRQIMKILSKPRTPVRYQKWANEVVRSLDVGAEKFQWSDCSNGKTGIKIDSIDLSPDPATVPGNVTISGAGSILSDLASPLHLELKVEKKVFLWVEIPCVDNIGSCSYTDICNVLTTIQCPPEFHKYNIPCRCPFKKGQYKLPPTSVFVDPVGVPEWLSSGDYRVSARATTMNGDQALCLNLQLSLK